MLAAALKYAAAGLHVFPAKFAGKKKFGFTSAEKSNGASWGHTGDQREIREYWRRWPTAAIGLPTGAVNGLFVIDIDTKAGGHRHDGEESLRHLEVKHGALPLTRTAISPTGSRHLYFVQPKGVMVPTVTNKLGNGIDTKGDGGFVIAPPSIRPGVGAYTWMRPSRIGTGPPWLFDQVSAKAREKAPVDPQMVAMMLADAGKGISTRAEDNISFAPMTVDDLEIEMRFALSVIPADEYDLWWRIGAAIYDGLGDAGFTLFDEWSRECPAKYDPRGCDSKWRECRKMRLISASTIFWQADRFDPGWRDQWRRYMRGGVSA